MFVSLLILFICYPFIAEYCMYNETIPRIRFERSARDGTTLSTRLIVSEVNLSLVLSLLRNSTVGFVQFYTFKNSLATWNAFVMMLYLS